MTAALANLNPAALVTLADCEQRIERGLKTYIDVGLALGEIRDSRLYRATHETFEAYCRERWGFTDRRARQLMEAAEIGNIFPVANSQQANELAKVPEADRADVLAEATERGNGKPTAEKIREVHEERTRPTSPGPSGAAHRPPADPGANPDPVAHPSWPTESELKPWETLAPTADRVAESMEPIADDPRDRTHGAEFESYDAAARESASFPAPAAATPPPDLAAEERADSTRRAAVRNLTSVLTFLTPLAITPAELAEREYAQALDEFTQDELDRAVETLTAIANLKRSR